MAVDPVITTTWSTTWDKKYECSFLYCAQHGCMQKHVHRMLVVEGGRMVMLCSTCSGKREYNM